MLLSQAALFGPGGVMPKEQALVDFCKAAKARERRVLVYTVYTGTRDTAARLRPLLESSGLKAAVPHATVDAARREG